MNTAEEGHGLFSTFGVQNIRKWGAINAPNSCEDHYKDRIRDLFIHEGDGKSECDERIAHERLSEIIAIVSSNARQIIIISGPRRDCSVHGKIAHESCVYILLTMYTTCVNQSEIMYTALNC